MNRLSVSKCAQCGTDMIAPEWSEHVSDRHVRNFWCCEACGYRVEDTIYFSLVGGMSMIDIPQKRESARACGDHR